MNSETELLSYNYATNNSLNNIQIVNNLPIIEEKTAILYEEIEIGRAHV